MPRLRSAARTLTHNPRLLVGVIILTVIVAIGALHGVIVSAIGHGQDPLAFGFSARWQPPNWHDPLGTDNVGRDVAALVVSGLWTSLQIGALGGVISTVIGIVIAFFAAYRGGWLDSVLATTTDLFLVIPTLPLLIAYSAFAKNISLIEIAVILAVFSWAGAARTIRSHVLTLRTRSFVDMAKLQREGTAAIVFFELVPNMLAYIALGLSLAIINTIFALVGLELIGLGPSGVEGLGLIINNAVETGALSLGRWPIFVVPIALLVAIFFGLNLINVGLDEAFNPRLRRAGA